MKTALQKALATIAPSICIKTLWEHDHDLRDIRKDCDGFENEDPEDWQAWVSEVSASAIVNGEEVSASAYLGGTWEKATDHPETSNPDISGYEPQMTAEALEELLTLAPSLSDEIAAALTHLHPSPLNPSASPSRNGERKTTPPTSDTMKLTGYNAPSKKALIKALNITPEKADTVRGLIRGEIRTKDETRFPKANSYFRQCHHAPDRLTRILECLNEVLESHGVETIGECRTYGPPAEYLNAGDTYDTTLVFDHIAGNFKITSWGDWMERNENKPAFKNW